jgi:hypothetical protein
VVIGKRIADRGLEAVRQAFEKEKTLTACLHFFNRSRRLILSEKKEKTSIKERWLTNHDFGFTARRAQRLVLASRLGLRQPTIACGAQPSFFNFSFLFPYEIEEIAFFLPPPREKNIEKGGGEKEKGRASAEEEMSAQAGSKGKTVSAAAPSPFLRDFSSARIIKEKSGERLFFSFSNTFSFYFLLVFEK